MFTFYAIFQVLVCYMYGGWLITNLFNIDGYHGYWKIFLIATDVSILLAAVISLSSFIFNQVQLLAEVLTGINMLVYIGMITHDFIYPPPTAKELMLYTGASLMVVLTFFWYEALVRLKRAPEADYELSK